MLEKGSCVGRPLNLSANAFCHDIPRIRVLDIMLPLTTSMGGGDIKRRPIICLNILNGLQDGESRTSMTVRVGHKKIYDM